jgi:hypothetical protein
VADPLCGTSPAVHVAGVDDVALMALDASHVYWIKRNVQGTVFRARRDPSGIVENFVGGEPAITLMAVGAGKLYWTTPSELRFVDVTAPVVKPVTLFTAGIKALAADDDDVYFITDQLELRRAAFPQPLVTGLVVPTQLAPFGPQLAYGDDAAVVIIGKDGSGVKARQQREGPPVDFLSDGTRAYWYEITAGAPGVFEWDGVAVAPVATTGAPRSQIASNHSSLYVPTTDGLVVRIHTDAAHATATVGKAATLGGIAADDTCVYYWGDTAIWRVAP